MSDKQAVARMQRAVQELEAERLRLQDVADTWRERAERAEARLASITGMQREELARTTAEAQRAADRANVALYLREVVTAGLMFRRVEEVADFVRNELELPLVTEAAP